MSIPTVKPLIEDHFQTSKRAQKKQAGIFLTHIAILEDPYFISRVEEWRL